MRIAKSQCLTRFVVSSSTNPYDWAATGDDATSNGGTGWVYTQQTYDWKGRPLVTTNTDTTYKSASYGGCGCAGSQVITLTDEVNRKQKIYRDVLGRQLKTEILNTDLTVYSTTTNTFDARDQVTLVRQYQGADTSTVYQDSSMSYDGYGRLSTKHAPEQQVDPNNSSSTDHTAYIYNSDDTVYSVTDARGALSTYGYNERRQVTSATHTLSGQATISMSYGYDAAGNRTSISHSVAGVPQDSASFSYDQLSRMTSETRYINALAGYAPNYGSYSINYGYTISGELQSVTDSFSSTTNLSYDTAGRTASVTGSYGGVNYNYATSVQYRASGAVKAATFGDSKSETVAYNSRLQPTQFRLTSGTSNVMRYDYSYFNDGRLKQLTDLDDVGGQPSQVTFHYMSRAYSYDHTGRVSSVSAIPNQWSLPAPFSGNYGYDAFNNMSSRSGRYGLNSDQADSATYTNNKRNGWTYDADGRVAMSSDNSDVGGSSTRTWSYDAAGEEISVGQTAAGATTTDTMAYDGEGELIYESVSNQYATTTDSLIHSSVLGTVLTKLDASGGKDTTYVPTNGLAMPLQQKDYQGNTTMSWVHRDVLGVQENGMARDPFGALIYNVQPPVVGGPPHVPFYGPGYYGSAGSGFTNANNFSAGCMLDGVTASCDSVMRAINSEMVDPNKTRFLAPGLNDFVNMGINTYATAAGSLIDPSSHQKPKHTDNPNPNPNDPDHPDVITTDTDEEYLPYWLWIMGSAFEGDPQNPAPGSFQACVGGLGATGFTQEAADLINKISGDEGTSRDLLAVTWMNESSFITHPRAETNGNPQDVMNWDVGPFGLNIYWTLKQVQKHEVSFGGLNERNVFGYNFYRDDGKTPADFTGDPLSNGRMGARRLNAIGGSDENKAIKYTKPSSQPKRKISYKTYAGHFRDFFMCYHPQ